MPASSPLDTPTTTRTRAQQKLRFLFRGQWANGMVPHIVFSEDPRDYFLGPDFWQAEGAARSPVYENVGDRRLCPSLPPDHLRRSMDAVSTEQPCGLTGIRLG